MVRLLLLLYLALVCLMSTGIVHSNEIYHSLDAHGRAVFSDEKPAGPHKTVTVEPQNDFDWHQTKIKITKKKKTRSKKKRHKRKKQEKTYTFDQLRAKCHTARYRYHNYRGRASNVDWGTYKAKLIKYSGKRDYWCSRYLARK